MKDKNNGYVFLGKVQSASKKVTKAVADTASNIAESTCDAVTFASEKVNSAIEEKKAAGEKARREQFKTAILPIKDTKAESYPSLKINSIDGGLAALKDMLTKSPLGGDNAVTYIDYKGKNVNAITRKAKDVDSLTILYSLYLIAEMTGRSGFSIREMLEADVNSSYVSPLVAFGIPIETFKRQCNGLYTKYPDYISTTFAHGNDGFSVFPDKHNTDDVISLALEGYHSTPAPTTIALKYPIWASRMLIQLSKTMSGIE